MVDIYSSVDFRHLSQAECAAAHGTDARTIRRWLKVGLPQNEDGTYWLAQTIKWRTENTNSRGEVDSAGILRGWR